MNPTKDEIKELNEELTALGKKHFYLHMRMVENLDDPYEYQEWRKISEDVTAREKEIRAILEHAEGDPGSAE